jgi:hypothetical protein
MYFCSAKEGEGNQEMQKKRIEGSAYFPVHPECKRHQPKISATEIVDLLNTGQVARYCDTCEKPWIFNPSETDMANLRRLCD